MNKAKKESEKLRHEAKEMLNALLKIPEGYSNGTVEQFVDCVIGAAVLEIAAIQQETAKHMPTTDNP